ncbi:MAG TPA: 2'-5' RNA ligase family protein [Bryobacteraceae bacterium]|jgi:2'-5' RNA ligase|nr:2'-5' RNA ligase family protein [Bryobacteraceae bacterium]
MLCDSRGQDRVNSFALVAYIPDPLRRFLDDLRRELVPGCVPAAHVTILPPRPLSGTVEEAIETIRTRLPEFSPFEIETGEVTVFPISDVVYLGIREGADRLRRMHPAFNIGPLEFKEMFPFHPHITLAQNLTSKQAQELAAVATRRWSEYPYPRVFPVEALSFVQNTSSNLWVDLAHFQLEPAAPVRR